jgi:hypothetical protein
MSNNALFTIEQVDNKLIITVEAVKPETVDLPETTEEPEARPMNADEIADWATNKFNLSTYDEINLRNYILNLLDYELNKAKR